MSGADINDLPGFWQSRPILVYLCAPRLSLAVTWIWATTGRARPDLTNCIPTDLFPHWAKKACILFSPTSVTNRSRDVVRRASLSLSLTLSFSSRDPHQKKKKRKTAWWNVYILHPVSLTFIFLTHYIHGSRRSSSPPRRLFTPDNDVWDALLEIKTLA